MEHHPGTRRATRKRSPRDGDGLWDWNLKSNRIHFSPEWISLAGCERHEIGNTPDDWFQRVHPDDAERLRLEIETLRSDGRCDFDLRYRLRYKDGTCRWMASQGLVVRDDTGAAIRLTGAQSDITVDTVTDPLTGLPNDLLLRDRLAHSIERARKRPTHHFALLLIDLGRPPGSGRASAIAAADPLLNAVARRLERCLRLPEMSPGLRQRDLVARLEGDLFAVLLDGLDEVKDAPLLAERLLERMLGPFTVTGREVRVTAAVGVAVSATPYEHPDEALRDARTALHRAHVLGGSHVEVFDIGALQSTQTDLHLEGELDAALQRRELQLMYQPIVSVATSRIVGFEALVRWQHPTLGTIAPVDFVSIAERTGLIVPFGEWILREACRQMRAWQADIPAAQDVWMSVNVSSVQARHPEVIEQIAGALHDSSLPGRSLVLELTEGTAMEDPAAVTTLLMQLRALGVRISIDDFGTGYSSLAYLSQFPVDSLKIDRSFVRRLDVDQDTVAIVTGMIGMARQLNLHVIAEGVEHEDQLAWLRSLQCDSAQGYLFARPLDADAATELLKADRPAPPERPRQETPIAGVHRTGLQAMEGLVPPARAARLAGAAVLAVLLFVGAVTLYDLDRPAASAAPGTAGHAVEETGDTLPAPDAGVSPPMEEAPTPTAPQLTAAAPVPPPAAAPPVAKPPQPPPALTSFSVTPPALASFSVVHLHRLGSCHGRLMVSPEGIAYVPDDEKGNDAFELKHADFFHTLERNSLTIRSWRRTYRFEAGASSTDDRAATLARIAEALSR